MTVWRLRHHDKTNKWVCAQQTLRSAWASAQSDQSSLSAWRKLGSLATHWAHSEDWWDWACWFYHVEAHMIIQFAYVAGHSLHSWAKSVRFSYTKVLLHLIVNKVYWNDIIIKFPDRYFLLVNIYMFFLPFNLKSNWIFKFDKIWWKTSSTIYLPTKSPIKDKYWYQVWKQNFF